jgi:hypothetical protein
LSTIKWYIIKAIYKTSVKALTTAGDLALALTTILGSHVPVSATDEICGHCYTRYKAKISRFQNVGRTKEI